MASLLAAELATLKICPGNEAHKFAKTLLDLVHKLDEADMDVTDQLMSDDMDIEEVLKNQKAMMEGIVSLSKLVTSMHDTLKRGECCDRTETTETVTS